MLYTDVDDIDNPELDMNDENAAQSKNERAGTTVIKAKNSIWFFYLLCFTGTAHKPVTIMVMFTTQTRKK